MPETAIGKQTPHFHNYCSFNLFWPRCVSHKSSLISSTTMWSELLGNREYYEPLYANKLDSAPTSWAPQPGSCGSILIGCFITSLWAAFPCFLRCLAVFNWMLDMANVTLLGAGYFAFLYIFLSFLLGGRWVIWEQFDPFESCRFWRFQCRVWAVAQASATYFPLCVLLSAPCVMCFQSDCREQAPLPAVCGFPCCSVEPCLLFL